MRDADDIADRNLTVQMNSFYGKLNPINLQIMGRAYRPGLWHFIKADPCDDFGGWCWSFTPWLTGDSDPCDEWFSFYYSYQEEKKWRL